MSDGEPNEKVAYINFLYTVLKKIKIKKIKLISTLTCIWLKQPRSHTITWFVHHLRKFPEYGF